MNKGGYKIVNFNGTALSGTAVELPGIYDQIVDDFDKAILVSGVSLNSVIMDDAYAGVQEKTVEGSKSVELTVYGGIITVTEDDEVTFATAKSNTELTEDIEELNYKEVKDWKSYLDPQETEESAIVKTMLTKNIAIVNIRTIGRIHAENDLIMTIPEGYRPINGFYVEAKLGLNDTCVLAVNTDGTVKVWQTTSSVSGRLIALFTYVY